MKRVLLFICIFTCTLLITTPSTYAQNPDLMLSPAERDSVLSTYKSIFPIWGRKVIERGFDLPYPFGVSPNVLQINQDIVINNLMLGVNDGGLVPVDEFIKFANAKSSVSTVNGRFDVWLFPFLNVFGFYGQAWTNTEVILSEPIAFSTNVDFAGQYYGIGLVAGVGIKQNFLSLNLNWAATDLDKLDNPVQARIFALRYGRGIKLKGKKRMSVWLGAQRQSVKANTSGAVTLNEVLPPDFGDALRDYQNTDWYQGLGPLQKQLVDELVQRVIDADLGNTKINYSLDKSIADPWNMLLGVNFELNKHWQARSEVGFIGRRSILFAVEYRFRLR